MQSCVTSPPYYRLRDYGVAGQIGQEATPDAYVARLVEVFSEVKRVLRQDGTCWLNLGDTLARKQLLGIPWRVAFALQADGWVLRSAIVWHKPNPMTESVTSRPTSAYEHVFLLAKADRYFYDAGAIAEPFETAPKERYEQRARITGRGDQGFAASRGNDRSRSGGFPAPSSGMRNARNVWRIATRPSGVAHFATMPPELAGRCIKAGSRVGDTVLDPFFGAGTTALVARELGRQCVGIELSEAHVETARARLAEAETARLAQEVAKSARRSAKRPAPKTETEDLPPLLAAMAAE